MKPAQLVTAVALVASTVASADSKAWTTGRVMIPETATIVGGISARSLRSSGLYQQFLPLLLSQAGQLKSGVDAFQKTCNIDVLGSIDSGAVGVDDNGVGTIVVSLKGTNHQALDACARKLAKADSKELAITAEGKFTRYAGTAMGDKAIYVAWLTAETLAVSTSPDDKDVSTRLLTSGIDKSSDLKRGLAGVNKNASVWLVGRKDTPLPDVGGKMTAFYVSANVANKKIDATAHLVTDSEKTANALTTDARKKLVAAAASNSNLKATLATVTFSSAGSEVVGSGSVAEDDVISLLMMLKR